MDGARPPGEGVKRGLGLGDSSSPMSRDGASRRVSRHWIVRQQRETSLPVAAVSGPRKTYGGFYGLSGKTSIHRHTSSRSLTAMCALLPFRRLKPSQPGRAPRSGVDRRVVPSKITALGSSARPSLQCSNARRSWVISAKTPALIQRRRLLVDRFPWGKLVGSMQQGAPERTIQRVALKTRRQA